MPVNKLALIRYKTIDNCLQNRRRKWTLDDLIQACSEALYEYEGIVQGISRRTIQLDIQNMRSEKLGYSAPIVVTDKKYYSYEDKSYSITNIPLSHQDMGTLREVLGVLKQFKGFGYFDELNSMVTRLEDKLYKHEHNGMSGIEFEKNELLKGLQHIDPIHKAIVHQQTLEVGYKSFKAEKTQTIVLYPYLLKEHRNRWFLLCAHKKNKAVMILALDRIEHLKEASEIAYFHAPFDIGSYFSDVIGVSKMPNQIPQLVTFMVVPYHAPYVMTKPLHASQQVLEETDEGTFFSINVIWNFELEKEILGFGEFIKVISPPRLVRKIRARSRAMNEMYR